MNGRTIPPYSIHDPSNSDADYPKHFRISFRNMPHCLSKEDIVTSCGLESFKMGEIIHQQRRLPNGSLFYTGLARVDVIIENLEEEKRLKEWSKDAFQQSFYCNGAIFQCYCPAFATNLEKASEKQNQQPSPQKKQATEHTTPEKQTESTIETQQEQTDSVTITWTQEVACEIEAVQPEQDAQEMECHSSSEEDTPENDTQTEPASKIRKRQKSAHYFDLIKRQIYDEKTMLRTCPEAQSLIEEQHHIRIEDDDQKCLNELFLVKF